MPRRRSGLTLTELLVALAIVVIAGALLLSRRVTRTGTQRAENAGELTAIVDSTRTLASARGESMRLRVYSDGLWSVEALTAARAPSDTGAADPIAAGTMTAPPAPMDLTVDKRGTCRASAGWVPREEHRAAFDAGKCRWDAARP